MLMRLDQFLKWQGWVGTGGEAKLRIQAGDVSVNGAIETRRGRQLQPCDRIRMGADEATLEPQQQVGP